MFAYVVRRLMSAVLVVVLTSMVVFVLFYEGPSDPAATLCKAQGHCLPSKLALIEHEMGRDQSVGQNYAEFVGGLFHTRHIYYGADYVCHAPCLGISYSTQQEVTKSIVQAYPATLSIAIGAGILYLLLGVSSGAIAARFRGGFVDRGLVSVALVISSIPPYLVYLVAWVYLYLQPPFHLKLFTDTTYVPLTQSPHEWFTHLLLPWLTLGITGATTYTRYARGSMVEALEEDYVRTARAKGAPTRRVVFGHALRAALAPVLTLYGLDIAGLLTGTIFAENIFNINGLGFLSLQSIKNPVDFPVLNATVLLGAVIVVLGNLLVDILYVFVDPRVRLA